MLWTTPASSTRCSSKDRPDDRKAAMIPAAGADYVQTPEMTLLNS
jgi:hypothetical protein